MQDAWLKLYKTVSHAAEVLSDPDKTFHYTMVDKLREQASLLKHLNATNDQTIEDVRAIVEDKLTKHDPKDIQRRDRLFGRRTERRPAHLRRCGAPQGRDPGDIQAGRHEQAVHELRKLEHLHA